MKGKITIEESPDELFTITGDGYEGTVIDALRIVYMLADELGLPDSTLAAFFMLPSDLRLYLIDPENGFETFTGSVSMEGKE